MKKKSLRLFQIIYKHFIRFIFMLALFLSFIHMNISQADSSGVGNQGIENEELRFYYGFEKKVVGRHDIKDMEAASDYTIRMAAAEYNVRAKAIAYDDLQSMTNAFNGGELDAIVMSSFNYIKSIYAKDSTLEFGPTAAHDGRMGIKYLLIGHKDVDYDPINQLKGKTLSLPRENDIEQLFVNLLLLKAGLKETEHFFLTKINQHKPSRSVLDVFFHRVDFCVVTDYTYRTMIELNPQIGLRTQIIAETPSVPTSVTLLSKYCSQRIRKIIQDELPKLKVSEKGKQLLTLFKVDDIGFISSTDLEGLRDMYSEYQKRINQNQSLP